MVVTPMLRRRSIGKTRISDIMPDVRMFLSKSPAPGADPTAELERVAWLAKADDRTLSLAVNRGGEMGFTYPMIAPPRDQLHKIIIPGLFSGVDYCIEFERNREIIWSGPMSTNAGSTNSIKSGRATLKAEGWRSLVGRRELREDVVYGASNNYMYLSGAVPGRGTDLPAGHTAAEGVPWHDWEIVQDLINRVIGYDPAHAPPIRFGTHYGTAQLRQKTWTKGTKLDQCLRELEELEAGIDCVIDPNTRLLDVYAWDSYADHPEIVYGFGRPPFNIVQFGWRGDFMSILNRLNVFGDNITPGLAQDLGSQDRFGIMEDTVTLTGEGNTDNLMYYAGEEVALKAFPIFFFDFLPKQTSDKPSQPKFFDNFGIGEGVRMSVNYGPFDFLEQKVRAFAVNLAYTKEGGESITQFQTTFSG